MTTDADDLAPEPTPANESGPDESGPETAQAETSQSELDLGVMSTGSVAVDRALVPLEALAERPVSGHAEVFEQVLDELAQTMAEQDPHERADRAERTEPGVPPASP